MKLNLDAQSTVNFIVVKNPSLEVARFSPSKTVTLCHRDGRELKITDAETVEFIWDCICSIQGFIGTAPWSRESGGDC